MNEPTDTLIDSLCADLQPCRKLRHPMKCACGWALIALAYSIAVVAFLGLRPDLFAKMSDHVFVFETLLMLAMGISAALATSWMRFPDYRGRPWVEVVPYTLLAVFLGWTAIHSLADGVFLQPLHFDHCIVSALLLVLVPVVAIVMMTRQGTTIRPRRIANMNTLAVTGLGYACLRVTCPADAVGHTFLYHFLPYIALGLILGSAARRLFRW